MGYLVGDLLPRSVGGLHFGCRTSKLGPILETPSPTTMLQGVHADPPSLYLWASGVPAGTRPPYLRAHRCEGSAHED
jgi:hypothetical protein